MKLFFIVTIPLGVMGALFFFQEEVTDFAMDSWEVIQDYLGDWAEYPAAVGGGIASLFLLLLLIGYYVTRELPQPILRGREVLTIAAGNIDVTR